VLSLLLVSDELDPAGTVVVAEGAPVLVVVVVAEDAPVVVVVPVVDVPVEVATEVGEEGALQTPAVSGCRPKWKLYWNLQRVSSIIWMP